MSEELLNSLKGINGKIPREFKERRYCQRSDSEVSWGAFDQTQDFGAKRCKILFVGRSNPAAWLVPVQPTRKPSGLVCAE
jgi:hypothetical protein